MSELTQASINRLMRKIFSTATCERPLIVPMSPELIQCSIDEEYRTDRNPYKWAKDTYNNQEASK